MNTYFVNNSKKSLTVKKQEQKQFVVFLDQTTNFQLDINLVGENSQAEILGIVIGNKKDVINLNSLQHHRQKHTTSNLLIRSLLFDQASFSFSGLIRIEKEGNLSDAYQKNESLLLSPLARSEAKPYLEILARDVRCTHGATLGTVNKEEIFYLTARGLTQQQAIKLIVEGYFQEMLDKINDLKIREAISQKISQKLM